MTNVMIFAAGFGTRMRPLTDSMPKALVSVAGRTLLDHALDQARAANPDTIVVNGHHFAAQLRDHVAQSPDVTFIEETGQVLETGGGLRNALPVLGPDPVLTLNSDAAWTGPMAAETLAAAWDSDRMDALLLLIDPNAALGGAGGWKFAIGPDGIVTKVEGGLTYTGAAIVKTGGLSAISDTAFSLRDLWAPMLEAGRLGGVEHRGGWADVGTPDGIARAERMLGYA